MARPNPFESAVRKARKAVDHKPLAKAVGKVVSRRLRQRRAPQPYQHAIAAALERKARRNTGRRRGRNQSYTPTAKPDVSRLGTFRHYMLTVIRKHTSTWEAETEHAACDNPKFAKNKLDFGWAAAEGYITFN